MNFKWVISKDNICHLLFHKWQQVLSSVIFKYFAQHIILVLQIILFKLFVFCVILKYLLIRLCNYLDFRWILEEKAEPQVEIITFRNFSVYFHKHLWVLLTASAFIRNAIFHGRKGVFDACFPRDHDMAKIVPLRLKSEAGFTPGSCSRSQRPQAQGLSRGEQGWLCSLVTVLTQQESELSATGVTCTACS